MIGHYPPYWWLRRLRRRGHDSLVSYGHCALCRKMWFVSVGWNVEEAVRKARHRPLCPVKLLGSRAAHTRTADGDGTASSLGTRHRNAA